MKGKDVGSMLHPIFLVDNFYVFNGWTGEVTAVNRAPDFTQLGALFKGEHEPRYIKTYFDLSDFQVGDHIRAVFMKPQDERLGHIIGVGNRQRRFSQLLEDQPQHFASTWGGAFNPENVFRYQINAALAILCHTFFEDDLDQLKNRAIDVATVNTASALGLKRLFGKWKPRKEWLKFQLLGE